MFTASDTKRSGVKGWTLVDALGAEISAKPDAKPPPSAAFHGAVGSSGTRDRDVALGRQLQINCVWLEVNVYD